MESTGGAGLARRVLNRLFAAMKRKAKPTSPKELLLTRETVRELSPEQLQVVVGGQCTKSYGGVGHI